jgi:hypothetical protein
MAAAVLAASLLMLTDLPGRSARAQTSTLEATLVGAGDIASCSFDRDSVTTRLLAKVPGTVFTLGDNVYPDGTLGQFRECYHPTWGAEKARTKPSVGNHEYHTQDAAGYFRYFGARAGDRARGYYTYKRGGAGASWCSTATAPRWADAADALVRAGGSSRSSPATPRSAPWPTSTIRCSPPPEPPPPR